MTKIEWGKCPIGHFLNKFLSSATGKNFFKPTFLQCQFLGQDVVRTFKKYGIKWNGLGKNGLKGDRLLTVTLGVSEEIKIGKLGKIRKIFEKCNRKKLV